MKLFKKVSALTSASAMTGLVVFAGAVGVANAAPVTLVIEPGYLVPGETATVTIDGCSVGSTLRGHPRHLLRRRHRQHHRR